MLLGRSKLALAAFLQPVLYHIKYCINVQELNHTFNNTVEIPLSGHPRGTSKGTVKGGWRLNRGLSKQHFISKQTRDRRSINGPQLDLPQVNCVSAEGDISRFLTDHLTSRNQINGL